MLYQVHPNTGCSESAGDVTVLRVFGPANRASGSESDDLLLEFRTTD